MAIYKVQAPDGTTIKVEGPDGADDATVIAEAQKLWSAQSGEATSGVAAQPRKAGGPSRDVQDTTGSLIQFNEDEDAAIKEASGGDPQKEHFLRLIPTIEWRGNADSMRSRRLSQKGAAGPYQFMIPTASAFGVKNRFDFKDSVSGAAKYYDEINERYQGNFDAMLADYNGGPQQAKALLEKGTPDAPETAEYIQLAKKYSAGGRIKDTTRAEFTTQTPEEQQAAAGTPPPKYINNRDVGFLDFVGELGKTGLAGADVAGTLVSGAVGQAAGGLAGLGALVVGMGAEGSSDVVKNVSDAVTWSPKSEYGQAFFDAVAPAAQSVDQAVKDTSMYVARGNPAVATALETGLNAGLILFGPGSVKAGVTAGLKAGAASGAKAGVKAGLKTTWKEGTLGKVHTAEVAKKAQQAQIKKISSDLVANAEKLGIELHRERIHESVRRVAEGQSSPARGAGFGEVSRELNAARLAEKSKVQQKWDDFRAQQHFTDVSWAKGTARQLAEELAADGFNVQSSAVMSSLEDLMGLQTQITTKLAKTGLGPRQAPKNILIKRQELKELQAIREKLIKRQKDLRGSSDGAAVSRIGQRLDEMLDSQFKADAAKGVDAPWQAWKEAKDAYGAYKDNWNEHKFVRDLIADPAMTPQKLASTLLGTSSMLGGKEASRVYDHIMMLTKNSPQVKMAVHGSVMYDLMKPLLDNPEATAGHFRAVANNFRRFRKENPELIKSMGLKEEDMVTIQHAARVAEHTKKASAFGVFDTVLKGITRHLVGHEIAQAGFRVKLSEKILNRALKRDVTSHRQMLSEFAGITTEPLTSAISGKELAGAMGRGELATQYQNLAEWDDWY